MRWPGHRSIHTTLDRNASAVVVIGDPTEAALLVAAAKAGVRGDALKHDYPRIHEIAFSSETKRMVTVHRTAEGKVIAYLKGAPGALIEACASEVAANGVRPLTPEERRRHEACNVDLAGHGLRVLALAYKELTADYREADLADGFVFIGLVGMSDPLRDEAKAAIAKARAAGIRTVMITGDQPATAASIAHELGIDRALDGRPLRAVHGRELAGLDADGWKHPTTRPQSATPSGTVWSTRCRSGR